MSKSYTMQYQARASEIETEAYIFPCFEVGKLPTAKYYTPNAGWDTGSERSIISQDVAKALHLQSLGKVEMQGIGQEQGDLYKVAIALPNGHVYHDFYVYGLNIMDYDLLIGMDIIAECDLAITNKDGRTTFSVRTPSQTTIDFEKE